MKPLGRKAYGSRCLDKYKPRLKTRKGEAMKKELRGIQISTGIENQWPYYASKVESIVVDCHLGSLIIYPDELLDYLEKRERKLLPKL